MTCLFCDEPAYVKKRQMCKLHYGRWHRYGDAEWEPATREDRFWSKVDASGDCWEWTGGATGAGYGLFGWREQGQVVSIMAHRYAWSSLVGPISDSLHIDHLCRNTLCVNPDHLQPVTPQVNTLRGVGPSAQNATKTYCKWGHPFDSENTYEYNGHRACLTCRRKRSARYNAEVTLSQESP